MTARLHFYECIYVFYSYKNHNSRQILPTKYNYTVPKCSETLERGAVFWLTGWRCAKTSWRGSTVPWPGPCAGGGALEGAGRMVGRASRMVGGASRMQWAGLRSKRCTHTHTHNCINSHSCSHWLLHRACRGPWNINAQSKLKLQQKEIGAFPPPPPVYLSPPRNWMRTKVHDKVDVGAERGGRQAKKAPPVYWAPARTRRSGQGQNERGVGEAEGSFPSV